MLIRLKNKDTLIIDDFKLKCCIGKKGLKKVKKEEKEKRKKNQKREDVRCNCR